MLITLWHQENCGSFYEGEINDSAIENNNKINGNKINTNKTIGKSFDIK